MTDVVALWDPITGKVIHYLEGHNSWVNDVTYSPDGRWGLSGSDSGEIILWDLATGEQIRSFAGQDIGVYWVAFSPDGQTVFASSYQFDVTLWDVETGEVIRRFPNAGYKPMIRPDGRSFYTYFGGGRAVVDHWRIDSRQELLAWTLENRYVRELTCEERTLYRVEPYCDDGDTYPTRTPLPAPTMTVPTTPTPTFDLIQTAFPPDATVTPAVIPRTIMTADVGDQRGEVPVGDNQIWQYEGQAEEILTIHVLADNPDALDTTIVVASADGIIVEGNASELQNFDTKPGIDTNSLIEGLVLPSDGLYYLLISAFEYRGGGAYTLIIESQPPPTTTPITAPSD
jgi:WD40 repeat protein